MPARFTLTPTAKGLFSNLAVESGLADAEIVRSVEPSIPQKTFSRLRIAPPRSVTGEQILFAARSVHQHVGVASDEVIAAVRTRTLDASSRIGRIAAARSFSPLTKDRARAGLFCEKLIDSSKRVYMFDRGQSFAYLAPDPESVGSPPDMPACPCATPPRISVVLTLESLNVRRRTFGDEGIEALIDHAAAVRHTLSVIDDSNTFYARARRGVFEDAKAVVIFDRTAMFVLPAHERCVRLYESNTSPGHRRLIAESIGHFRRMRNLRQRPVSSVHLMLLGYLSYSLPLQKGSAFRA